MRARAVRDFALEFDDAECAGSMTNSSADSAVRNVLDRTNMSTESVVDVIQDAVVIRLQSTEEGFFSRLEEEFYAAFFDVADELGGCGKNHSGVRVMAAGVDAGIFPSITKGRASISARSMTVGPGSVPSM